MIAAVVPAAGRSERMGRPKLILPVGGRPVIARVVAALRDGGAGVVVVVAPPAVAEGARTLIAKAEAEGARVVVPPGPTADMRASVELGLEALARGRAPVAVLLAPGDSPRVGPELVARVVAAWRARPGAIVVPTCRGRRGHPIALPWPLAGAIRSLPAGVGVNALLAAHAGDVAELEVDDPGALIDLDTPDDYRRLGEAGPSSPTDLA